MNRQTYSFVLEGGLDEVTQPLALKPGRAILCLNHEVVDSGYGRIGGFERFDGRTSPTDFPFYLMSFDTGTTEIEAGDTITGATSGATGIVLSDASVSSGSWAGGDAAGQVGFRTLTGNFTTGENLQVSASTVARVSAAEIAGTALTADDYEATVALAARTYARALIQAVPGSGAIRGVWEFGGSVYAFRDNAGGTAVDIHKSTASGWSKVDLGKRVAFTSGGTTAITEGDTITGATSGASATVERIALTSGAWADGDAAGWLVLSGVLGTFVAENLDVGASSDLATIAGAPSDVTLPAGGRYRFVTHNFYGASGTRRVYGCNGVGPAFEFDGAVLTPIETGADTDTPTRVAVFRNHLFLALPNGGWQNSATGEPLNWEALLGAFVGGIGSEIADFVANTDSLMMLGEDGIFVLTGSSSADWVLGTITLEAGALPWTGQRIDAGIYLDNRGLRSVRASQNYGNFAMGTMSETARRTMRQKAAAGTKPCASAIVRNKNHYRLFYDDGSGLSFYLGRKYAEPMYFDLGKVVRCISSNESADDVERIFFGSDDGYIYQLDKGTSFDGGDIEAFIQLPYASLGSPNVMKRVFKVGLEATAEGHAEIGVAVEYDYALSEQQGASLATLASTQVEGQGGIWALSDYANFFWSSPVENTLEVEVEGQGRNASIIAYTNSAIIPPYVLRAGTYYYAARGAMR